MKPTDAWTADDAERLKRLRSTTGWDISTLARAACLSATQVNQLEQGGDSHFYTAAIKLLAGRRAFAALESWGSRRISSSAQAADAAQDSQVRVEVPTPPNGAPCSP